MFVCHLNRNSLVWDKYTTEFDTEVIGISGHNMISKFFGNIHIVKAETDNSEPLMTTICTVDLDSTTKGCRIRKIGQFSDRSYEIIAGNHEVNIMLTKSKRLGLIDSIEKNNRLILETFFFQPPLTLKELSTLALVQSLCEKVVIEKNSRSCLILSRGPSAEVQEKLGLNNAAINFGELEP